MGDGRRGGKEGRAPARRSVLSREWVRLPARTPGVSAPSPLGQAARSHLSEKLSTTMASLFMIWHINELGNLFAHCVIILMLMVFILLPTYNRIPVIKLPRTYAALKSVTGEKEFAVLTFWTSGANRGVLAYARKCLHPLSPPSVTQT